MLLLQVTSFILGTRGTILHLRDVNFAEIFKNRTKIRRFRRNSTFDRILNENLHYSKSKYIEISPNFDEQTGVLVGNPRPMKAALHLQM